MNRLSLVRMLLVVLVIAATGPVAMVRLPHPASWRQTSRDGRYVLVMVSPLPVGADAASWFDKEQVGEIRRIRAVYSQCGLYRNDGTTTPLWNIEYFSRPQQVYIAPDGKHLIVGAEDLFVGSFFADGKSLAGYGYSLRDIVAFSVVKSVLSLRQPSCVSSSFDADNLTYTVRTNQGEEFTFDVTTGRMVKVRSPWPLFFAVICVGVIAALGLLVVLRSRKRQNAERGHS